MATSSTVQVVGSNIVMPGGGKITNMANGTAATDAAAFGQVATIAVATPSANDYPAITGAVGKYADSAHVHPASRMARTLKLRTDFITQTATELGIELVFDGMAWGSFQTGGAGVALATNNSVGSVIGSCTHSTQAGATNYGAIAAWHATSAGTNFPWQNADAFEWEWAVRTPTAVSDGTETYKVRVGVMDQVSTAPSNGVWFEWDANADTHILCKTATGGTPTTAVTSSVVAGTGWHVLGVTKAAGTGTIHFWIDGVDVGTGTLPLTNPYGPASVIVKSAGTTPRLIEWDWFMLDYTFAAARH